MTTSLIAGDRDGMGARLSRTVYRPTESLKVDSKNPTQIGQIVQSMTVFGNIVSILVEPDLHVIAGRTAPCWWSPMPSSKAPSQVTVVDACLRGGTTLIAAERVRRRCYAVGIDPSYVVPRSDDGRPTPVIPPLTPSMAAHLMTSAAH